MGIILLSYNFCYSLSLALAPFLFASRFVSDRKECVKIYVSKGHAKSKPKDRESVATLTPMKERLAEKERERVSERMK